MPGKTPKVKNFQLTLIAFFILTFSFGQTGLDDTFVGIVPIYRTLKSGKKECYSDPTNPNRKWYHLTYLKIKGDSVFADQNPIHIYKGDTLYSSSDGGFYYYKGTINKNDSSATIKLQLIYCDYCPIPKKDSPKAYLFPKFKNFTCRPLTHDILVNDIIFKRTVNKQLFSEYEE